MRLMPRNPLPPVTKTVFSSLSISFSYQDFRAIYSASGAVKSAAVRREMTNTASAPPTVA